MEGELVALVIGIDPGLQGALGEYDTTTGTLLRVFDMPTFGMKVGKRVRKRVDAIDLADYFETVKMCHGNDVLVVIEAVGNRQQQSQASGTTAGYGIGLIFMACIMCRIPVETVPAREWKKMMKVPGKVKGLTEKQSTELIIRRAVELFPDDRDWFHGPRGGGKSGRAEAAMLALFGGRHVLNAVGRAAGGTDSEWRAIYRNAATE